MPTAEVISIGTELLLGEIQDTNMRFIARELRDLGIDLFRTTAVGDNEQRIMTVIKEAVERSDLIITTGGLGPTVDDTTREAVCSASGLPLIFNQEIWDGIMLQFNLMKMNPGRNQKKQAYLPLSAIPFNNPQGTAPGFYLKVKQSIIACLPGVPHEMKRMFKESLIPFITEELEMDHPIQVRILHTAGAGEGWIDEKIGDLELSINPTVGLAAKSGIVDIRIATRSDSLKKSNQLIDAMEKEIRRRLGDTIFGVDQDTLEMVTLRSIKKNGWKLITVENGSKEKLSGRFAGLNDPIIATGFEFTGFAMDFLHFLKQKMEELEVPVGIGINIHKEQGSTHLHQVVIIPGKCYDKRIQLPDQFQYQIDRYVSQVINHLRLLAEKYSIN
ncbi:competence/damage-inducible protein A [Chloroflexota bacterium]